MRALPLLLALTAGCAGGADTATPVDTGPACDFSQDPCDHGAAWITTCETYPTIQAALDAATNGTTVHVCAGTHTESLHLSAAAHPTQHINLDGDGPGATIVEAAPFDTTRDGAPVREGMVLYNDGVELDIAGMRLEGGSGYTWSPDSADADSFGGALYLVDSRVQLYDVVLAVNSANHGGAIYAEGSEVTLSSVGVKGNTSLSAAYDLLDGTLTVTSSDWATGGADNTPADVLVEAQDDGAAQTYTYGDGVSFRCDAAGCVDG